MKQYYKLQWLTIFFLVSLFAKSQVINGSNYGGADLIPANGAILNGTFTNVGTFEIPAGVTVYVQPEVLLSINANKVIISGTLNAVGKGYKGGLRNASTTVFNGLNGSGPGAGQGGSFGNCVHGNGGSGAAYGGNGGNTGSYFGGGPSPNLGGVSYGNSNGSDLSMGSGGGSGANYCDLNGKGGEGGNGGGAVVIISQTSMTISGNILANGEAGKAGIPNTYNLAYAGGGGGSGGGIKLSAQSGMISGTISAVGGGGNGDKITAYAQGGAGGGGGRIIINGLNTGSAIIKVDGGLPGPSSGTTKPQAGSIGSIFIQNEPLFTLSTGAIPSGSLCQGALISIPFTANGTYNAGNTFTAQLSDASGSFASPTNIGSVSSTVSGSINATIPANTPAGTGYRIRVVSSDPVVTGSDNGSNITINALPTATITAGGPTTFCPSGSVTLTASVGDSYLWSNGATTQSINATATGSYSVTVTTNGCSATSAATTVTVEDNLAPVPNVANLPDATGECSVTVGRPTATDNCKGTVTAETTDPLTYTTQGEYTITWTYDDGNGNTSQQTQKVLVKDVTAPSITAPADMLTVKADADQCYATIANLGTPGTSDNCGVDAATISNDAPAQFSIGTTLVKWTVKDIHGNTSAVATQTIVVTDDQKPVITHNGNKTLGNEAGKCGAAVMVSATASDNCSVGSPTGSRSDGKALTDDYPVGVTTTITWNVTDVNGVAAIPVTQTVTVTNTAPSITMVSASLDPVAVNTATNLTVTYTDNNVTSAAINWGDGTPVQQVASPAGTFMVPHTYTAAGVYTVKVSVNDACNVASNEYVYQYIVIYDPNGPFVTGGGWINSPAGAFVADPALIGKANFGFVSKYQKGATVPSGNTDFQFHAGNLNFKSARYEWLVVSGSKAQFKGVGTINGTGDFGFLLSSVDGNLTSPISADKFRIKIWNRSNGATVYDNQIGAADDATAVTEISGGSIVIHSGKSGKSSIALNERGLREMVDASSLVVKALPNPSAYNFTLVTKSSKDQTLTIRILDATGRTLEVRGGVAANGSIILGHNYKSGTYFAEVVQGTERVVVKLVKTSE